MADRRSPNCLVAKWAGLTRDLPCARQPCPHRMFTHELDYSHNKTYEQGVREDRADHAHNREHSKKRHFKQDDRGWLPKGATANSSLS
jgi:hypothetical protein